MRSAFGVFRILIVYGEVVQQLPMLPAVIFRHFVLNILSEHCLSTKCHCLK